MVDPLSTDILEGAIRGRFGRTLHLADSTTSTNADALEWAVAGAPEGALVVADYQTAGRGRRGRSWLAEPGTGLLFSLVLRPRLPLDRTRLITTALGVACAEALDAATRLPARIKWPNDVTVRTRKLAGILVETRMKSGALEAAVAGVGINVLHSAWPSEIAARATSVAAEMELARLGPPPPRAQLLAAVLESFEGHYQALSEARSAAAVVARAEARSEILGSSVRVEIADGRTIEGRAVRLLPSGSLELDTEGGVVAVDSGEVERLRRTDVG